MSIRTVFVSSFEEYWNYITHSANYGSPEESANYGSPEEHEANKQAYRQSMLSPFRYAVMLLVSFPEIDFANRWCWQNFGPRDGECDQRYSNYPVCTIPETHSHSGRWTSNFLDKTDYDFGFCEWYFAERSDYEMFVAFIDQINWGENFPVKSFG